MRRRRRFNRMPARAWSEHETVDETPRDPARGGRPAGRVPRVVRRAGRGWRGRAPHGAGHADRARGRHQRDRHGGAGGTDRHRRAGGRADPLVRQRRGGQADRLRVERAGGDDARADRRHDLHCRRHDRPRAARSAEGRRDARRGGPPADAGPALPGAARLGAGAEARAVRRAGAGELRRVPGAVRAGAVERHDRRGVDRAGQGGGRAGRGDAEARDAQPRVHGHQEPGRRRDHRPSGEHRADRRRQPQRAEPVPDRQGPAPDAGVGRGERGGRRQHLPWPAGDVHGRRVPRRVVRRRGEQGAAQRGDDAERRDVHRRGQHRQLQWPAAAVPDGQRAVRGRPPRRRADRAQRRPAVCAATRAGRPGRARRVRRRAS